MNVLKQKQVNQFIFNVKSKIKNDFPLVKYTLEEFVKVLNIPNNEELIHSKKWNAEIVNRIMKN